MRCSTALVPFMPLYTLYGPGASVALFRLGVQKEILSAHRFAWFVLLKGGGEGDGRDHGLGSPLLRFLPRVDGQCAKVRELLVF